MHAIEATPEMAAVAAEAGVGGGYLGSLFERILWFGLGGWGLVIVLIAWMLIALTMILDVNIEDLFRWVGPLKMRLTRQGGFVQVLLAKISRHPVTLPGEAEAKTQNNGYTPLEQKIPAPGPLSLGADMAASIPTVTVTPSVPVIQWVLPEIPDILDAGSAPAENEDFIKQRAHLIEETLASFGAPAQVVEISRGPTITQFGVEPLFVETRGGRTRVRVSKIASLADDLALALAAPRIRIQAPVPGHSYVGIEVPND